MFHVLQIFCFLPIEEQEAASDIDQEDLDLNLCSAMKLTNGPILPPSTADN